MPDQLAAGSNEALCLALGFMKYRLLIMGSAKLEITKANDKQMATDIQSETVSVAPIETIQRRSVAPTTL